MTSEEIGNELQMAEELVDPLHIRLSKLFYLCCTTIRGGNSLGVSWLPQRKSIEFRSKALEKVMKLLKNQSSM